MPQLISRIDNDDKSTITETSSYDYKTDLPGIRSPFNTSTNNTIQIPDTIETSHQETIREIDDESILSSTEYNIPTMRLRGGDGIITDERENEFNVPTRFQLNRTNWKYNGRTEASRNDTVFWLQSKRH
jgi:hypothetical protein